ncbi:D-alanyl-D-alanine carboxypeptidase family protein [Ketogulonicigenium vulgare]|uniref:D-alanyl-D-alanine carboxypeptidase family protein n=1 Tax=Ketogulonicigenium vulgare TaxID=92945 RepID=UPI00235A3718|nr:serine hydrolase [Ketogulonicigenium vulgare]
MAQLAGKARLGLLAFIILCAAMMSHAFAAPYAALVMDARTGQVLDSENADTRLHPASLTKMMTLYIAFQAIERGEVSLNSQVTVSANAAAQPPSRLGLRAGQRIELQYLIRAAAIKSANDAATAIGVGISGSEEAFAARMNATARAMGMNNTHFISMNGLTTNGHYSTARDMTILGRHLIYDFPQYYNLFSRRSADAGIATVRTTNSRLLDNYQGADGIKTGYTQAAGYNLTASAERGNVRIIATVFGATSNADRHTRITRLMDRGFANAPRNARLRPPEAPPAFLTPQQQQPSAPARLPETPPARPTEENFDMNALIAAVSASAAGNSPPPAPPSSETLAALRPIARPSQATAAVVAAAAPEPAAPPPFQVISDDDLGAIASDSTTADAIAEAVALAVASDPAAPAVLRPMMRPRAQVAAATPAPAPVTEPVAEPVAASEPVQLAAAEPLPAPAPVEDAQIIASFGETEAQPETLAMLDTTEAQARPQTVIMTTAEITPAATGVAEQQVVSRMSTSGGRLFGVNIGRFNSSYAAERELMRVAMMEVSILSGSQRTVSQNPRGFDANFVGMTRDQAELACGRLQARSMECNLLDTN